MSSALTQLKAKLNKNLSQRAISLFAALGFAYTLKKGLCALLTTAYQLWRFLPTPTRDLATRYGKGSWALITGSTDGIGKAFAIAFAKRGFNVIIFGRTAEKLKKVSESLTNEYKVQVKTIQVDFSQAKKPEFFEDIYKQTLGLDISIIVNDVGFGDLSSNLMNMDKKSIFDMNIINLLPVVMLTRLYINDLLKRQHRSCIINLSSVAAYIHVPGVSVYGAGKAFVDCLTENMAIEYKDKIDMLSVRPDFVDTPLYHTIGGQNIIVVRPEQCAEGSLRWLGKGTWYTHGAPWHEVVGYCSEVSTWFAWQTLVLAAKTRK